LVLSNTFLKGKVLREQVEVVELPDKIRAQVKAGSFHRIS